MRWLNAVFFCLLMHLLTISNAIAENRVALVIGNGAYKNAPALANPLNDAPDVSAALTRPGFDVILQVNLDQLAMQDALIRFARAARTADVAIFYYSGHALQFAGANYLAPIDAIMRDEADLKRMTRVDEILADLQQAKNLRILVLDSCRDNPFADDLKRSIGRSRSAAFGRGLAKMESPDGTIISYATQAGRTAEDGRGRNSPYTSAFLKHFEEKDNITTVFQHIGAKVYTDTKGLQVPELSLSFFGEYYLNGRREAASVPAPVLAPATTDPCAGAADSWHNSDTVGTLEAYKDHLVLFPSCTFAQQAQSKIAALSKTDAAPPSNNLFDGVWVIKEVCNKNAPIWPSESYEFVGNVKQGSFSYHYGTAGAPKSAIYEGKIDAEGAGEISVKGLTGSAESDPLHRSTGTPFSYKLAVKLDGTRGSGAGVRVDTPQLCHSTWSRLTATTRLPSNAERENAATDARPGEKSEKEQSQAGSKSNETKRTKAAARNPGIELDRREAESPTNRRLPELHKHAP